MRIPAWRLALTAGAIVLLAAVGVSLVAASSNLTSAGVAPAAGAPSASPALGGSAATARDRLVHRIRQALGNRPFRQHLVHATVTVTDRDGRLITLQLDHGTITSIGSGALRVAESGGSSVTVSTDATTVVRLGGGAGTGSLSDLKVGDEVFVQSRLDGGTALAKHILRVPPSTGS